jgi:hypothetical protein
MDHHRKNPVKHSATFSDLLDDISYAFRQVMRLVARAVRHICNLPWPALLAASILLAFAITIIPLALMLFAVLLLLKFAVAAIVIGRRRHGG